MAFIDLKYPHSNFSIAPARKRADHTLPLVPNKIYLHIFEYIAPPTGPLAPEELAIFTKLSYVCRFFANHCLARMFEYFEFAGFHQSCESMLCTQIAAKQSLTLAIAKTVRVCRFSHWIIYKTDSWAVLFAPRFIDAISHMKHLRELRFCNSSVDARLWNAIAMLGSLEKLVFDECHFVPVSAHTSVSEDDSKRIQVSHLQVMACTGNCQAIVAIHPRYLCMLVVDMTLAQHIDWLGQSALTELHLCFKPVFFLTQDRYLERLPIVLACAPESGLATKYIVHLLRSSDSDSPVAVSWTSLVASQIYARSDTRSHSDQICHPWSFDTSFVTH
ncbi:hypothetical protein L210DRAFT_3638804 [Boletus edulis BED1]|uniref:F-box domain-containing protein n=1 Tax=Boletus edulis BED1 TaxID=1328754 RepID=A0AAD4C870_BOLED|nr:hypothetical protein L210DRAFT_3638804 [Boletus edulis BED1]